MRINKHKSTGKFVSKIVAKTQPHLVTKHNTDKKSGKKINAKN